MELAKNVSSNKKNMLLVVVNVGKQFSKSSPSVATQMLSYLQKHFDGALLEVTFYD